MRLTHINRYLDLIILTNYCLILTNYQLRMTKTEYVEYEIVSVNIGQTLVKHQLAGLVKRRLISVHFFMRDWSANFLDFRELGLKFVKFFMSILNWQVNSSSAFASFFIVMTHNSPLNFKLIRMPPRSQFEDFQVLCSKFAKFLMTIFGSTSQFSFKLCVNLECNQT